MNTDALILLLQAARRYRESLKVDNDHAQDHVKEHEEDMAA